MQTAADAAAIEGSFELVLGSTSNVGTKATQAATNNGWDSSSGTITVRSYNYNATYPASGNYTTNDKAVEVIITQDFNVLFASSIFADNLTISARAVGLSVAGSAESCILSLGADDQSDAFRVGGSAVVTMSGCNAATNSTHDGAIDVDGGLTIDCIYSAGGIDGTANTTTCTAPGFTNQPEVTDPYEDSVTKPVASDFDDCDSAGDVTSGDGSNYKAPPSNDYDLDPGVYCDIDFGANNQTLILSAGTYYIDQGDFEVGSGAVVDGTAGVTIVFGDSTWDGTPGTADCGGFKITGASYVDITAPVTEDGEPFTGLALYRSSECDDGGADDFEFVGTTTSTILGAIYNPSGEIKVSGNGSLSGTCLQLIADDIEMTGNGNIGSSCDDVDVRTIYSGGVGSLVE